MVSDGFHVSGSLMWILIRISGGRVPSILSELQLGVFWLRENILSTSPTSIENVEGLLALLLHKTIIQFGLRCSWLLDTILPENMYSMGSSSRILLRCIYHFMIVNGNQIILLSSC